MQTAFISKLLLLPLFSSLVFTPVSAQTSAVQPRTPVQKSTTISFRNSPGNTVMIKSDGSKVSFTACKNGVCSPVGKADGYTPLELTARYSQLRKSLLMNRLVVIPAGAMCAALLGSAVGFMEVQPLLESTNQATAQIMEGVHNSIENGGIGGVLMAPATITTGVMAGAALTGVGVMVAYSIVFTYATVGFMIGLPGTWLLTKLIRPNFSNASKMIKDGILRDNAEITTGQDFEKYLTALEFALPQ